MVASPVPEFEAPPVAILTALSLARKRLGMQAAFVSQVHEGQRVVMFVDSELTESELRAGVTDPLDETYCQRVLDGTMPRFVPDTLADPALASVPSRERYGIGAYVGVPVTLSDGRVFGTLCCLNSDSVGPVDPGDLRDLEVLAAFVGEQVETEIVARARQERQRTEERVALIQSIAHEFRTPLTVIQGVAGMLERMHEVDPEEARALVAAVASSSRRLGLLVERVVTSAEAMNPSGVPTAFDPEAIVAETAKAFDADAQVAFTTTGAPFDPVAAPSAVAAVLCAATEHALLQSVPGSRVEVSARAGGGRAVVTLAYESLGVERAGDAEVDVQRTSGAGVRLLLADVLVRRLGGRLDFRLERGGRATIEFALPLARA